jgi:CBS domain-containing protein
MTDTRKQQNEPGGPGTGAAHRAISAVEAAVQASGDALRRSGTAGARVAEQDGRAVSEAIRRTGGSAAETTRRGAQLAAEAQRRFIEDAAEQIKEAGQELTQALQQSVEDARMLMPLLMPPLGVTGDGLGEVQRALAGVAEGTTRANLRIARELLRLANPGAIIELQQRIASEYLGALAEGQASLLRAAGHAAEQALRPIEHRLEQGRLGRQAGDQGSRSRREGRVADVMSRHVRVASPEDTVQQAARTMREEDTGVLPVGEDDRLVGMVTDRDVALRLVAEGKDPARTRVREVMTPEVRYVFEDEDLGRAAEAMAEQQVRRLPVVNRDKRLVGIVSLGDLATDGRAQRLAGRALAGVAREGGQHNQVAAE